MGEGSKGIDQCICETGYYADTGSEHNCVECDKECMLCTDVGITVATIIPADGFWRSDNSSLHFIPCPYGADACSYSFPTIGGAANLINGTVMNYGGGKCREGHEGFVCSTCSTGFYQSRLKLTSPCKACSSISSQTNSLLVMLVGGVLIGMYIINKNIRFERKVRKMVLGPEVNGKKSSVKLAKTSVVRRLLLNQLQLIGLVGQFNLSWPDVISEALTITDSVASLSPVNGDFGSAVNCLVRPNDMILPVFNIFMSIGLILIGLALVTVFWIFIHPCIPTIMNCCFCCRNSNNISQKQHWRRRYSNVFVCIVIVLYMAYSSLARVGFSMFSCELFDGEEDRRLRNALDVKCFVGEHMQLIVFLGIPFILLVVIGLPLLALVGLYKHRDNLDSPDVLRSYGFFFRGYQLKYWYWESVILIRKLSLAALSVFMAPYSPYIQGLSALLIVTLALVIQQTFNPYTSVILNRLEALGLICGTVTLYLGLWTFADDSDNSDMIGTIVTVMIVAVNSFWFFTVIMIFFQGYISKPLRNLCCKKKTPTKTESTVKEPSESSTDLEVIGNPVYGHL